MSIPTTVLREARVGFALARGHVRVLSARFGKVCLAHAAGDRALTQLRLVREQADTEPRLEAEMAWLTHLSRQHRLAVPVPMRWRNTRTVSPVLIAGDGSQWRAVTCSWVPGRHLDRGLRTRDMKRAGGLLARMHLANLDAPPEIASARHVWDIPGLFTLATAMRDVIDGSVASMPGVPALLVGALRTSHLHLADAWRALPIGSQHEGLIHTDAHQQNLRFTERAVGIVDFEDLARGRFMLDIACFWSGVERRRGSDRMLAALLDGYDRERALPDSAIRDLRVMLAFRRFDYAGWVLSWPRLDHQSWGPQFLARTPSYMERWLAR